VGIERLNKSEYLLDIAGKMVSEEFEFYLKTDLGRYKGLYIAIVGSKVVAYGDNAKMVIEEAKKKTGKIPTIAKVPKEEALILRIKWR